MRLFRIPAFTGIETHRDDADRGSLRIVEGCVPHGPGGLRSGPVWKKVGDVDLFSDSDQNHMTAGDDGKGNSVVYVSRTDEVHDIAVFSTEHTDLVSLGASYNVAAPTPYRSSDAVITPIGNRLYAMGDGTAEAAYIGKGPPTATASVFPDEMLYDLEWSRFPSCKFYTQGPKKTIFAAGNPEKPLTVYISEPAGLTSPYRDNPYSTEETTHHPGALSTVDILSSNASKITALSTRGDQVVVHTDKGCHLLYSPKADQAETGYRVEQVPATNFSGAVNAQVVAGESGSQHFWMGHDGQIYKDEAATRGPEDFKNYADAAQANWKAKGQWEKEHPVDLSDAFATYDPQSGMYWVYTRSDEYDLALQGTAPDFPLNLQSSVTPDAPGTPSDLESLILTPDAPGAPQNLQSAVTIDAPGAPQNLQSAVIIEAPGAPQNLGSAITAVDPIHSSLRNNNSIKLQLSDGFNTPILSPTFMNYAGLRDTADLQPGGVSNHWHWKMNLVGTKPSWVSTFTFSTQEYWVYIVGDHNSNDFYVYHFVGNPNLSGMGVGYSATTALSANLFGSYFINNGNQLMNRNITLSP